MALPQWYLSYSAFMVTLEESKLFRQIAPKDLAPLRRAAGERQFASGQEIFKEGDEGDGVYVVKEGKVEISARVGQEERRVFSQIGPGDFFGEMAVLEEKPRSACATAREKTVTVFIPRSAMLEFLGRSPALALSLLREISRRLREFNRQYLREVVQAERLAVVGRFARSIVHDLKNPLHVIGLTAEMAGMSQATAEQRERANTCIRQQVDRINDLVGEILDFTQGTSPEQALPLVNYAGFVQEVLDGIRPEVALKSTALELAIPPPAVLLPLNSKRLRRVFHNLIQNATDAMADGGRILLRFEAKPNEVVTEIEDTGPGIAPEIAGQLFEPFATYGKARGTGLGLSICRKILEDHRGWILSRKEPGRGAIFAFGLPIPRPA
jgi:signal transduction histidine kinase